MLRAMRTLLALVGCLTIHPAAAQDPDDFDPLLDGGAPKPPGTPLVRPDHRAPGFNISGHAGLYTGATSSFLDPRNSLLLSHTSYNVGVGFGFRTPSLIELGVDLDLGLGETWDREQKAQVFAFDVLITPRVLAHVWEGERGSLYVGAAADVILFDAEPAGLNQAGVGPALILGGLVRLDDHSLLYLEVSGDYFYDFLAYTLKPPSEEALLEDPTLKPRKVYGEWFNIYRVTAGYRLVRF